VLLYLLISLPFVGSVIAALLPANARNAEAWLAGVIAIVDMILLATCYDAMANQEVLRVELEWLPEAGLNFILRLDGFTWLFAALIAGIGLLVVLYARYYLSPADPAPRFFSFFLAFMGSMLGIVLSGNLIQLIFFWELTSLFSFLLIGYWHYNASAREGARVALTVTSAGGLCLFAGILLVGHIVGSYDLDRVLASGNVIRSHALYLPAFILILVGALTKSAQFPFHFWLPRAMAAPTPVSAYLHSATMVKAGVFLLIRLWPVLAGTDYWLWFVGGAGLITFVLGAYFAIFQQDLKGLLAYSTISHLGLTTLLIGLDSPLALVAAIFHLVNHATFKASLFMAAGIVDHETGTRDLRRLSGLYPYMPITATLAMVAAAAMAGVPLLNGFLSKEMFFAETIEIHDNSLVDQALPYFATVASIFAVVYSLRFIVGTFFGPPPTDLPRTPHEPPGWMRFPVELLVLACLVVGMFPAVTVGPFLSIAVSAVLGNATPDYDLAVWHGLTLPLLMSGVAIVGGTLIYLLLRPYLRRGLEGPPLLRYLKGKRIFEHAIVILSWRWARTLELILSTRRLQQQLRVLVVVAFVAAWTSLSIPGLEPGPVPASAIDPAFTLLWVVGVVCTIGAAWQAKYHRVAALILFGGSGLVICITFVWLSAPDLALTQLVVEAVTTVLILLGLRWLPKRFEEIPGDFTIPARLRRLSDLVIAAVSGAGLTMLSYAVMTRPHPQASIADFFLERAYTEGGGRNVVNVILVDFRGFDTIGEITVLGVVALSVFALLRRFRPAADSVGRPTQQRSHLARDALKAEAQEAITDADFLMIPKVLTKLFFPVIGLVGVFLLLRGHDQPGGGFVAGLTIAVAVILQYMTEGARWVERRLRVHPLRWMAFGLLVALVTGASAWLAANPFLTSLTADVDFPLVGKVHLASVLLFDLGILSLVLGATSLMLIALAHQSLRSHRVPAAPEPAALLSGVD
jgi:multicomponent K+:H+ antiporter subunit A